MQERSWFLPAFKLSINHAGSKQLWGGVSLNASLFRALGVGATLLGDLDRHFGIPVHFLCITQRTTYMHVH